MRRLGIALTTVAALALGGPAALPAQATDPGPTVTGTVTLGGRPIVDRSVDLSPVTHGSSAAFYTSDTGTYNSADEYSALGVVPGTYTASVRTYERDDADFLTTYYGNTVREPDATRITLDTDTVATVDIEVKAAGTATGKVVDSKGKPVTNADVWVYAINRYGDGFAETNKAGKYKVRGLPTGLYRVYVKQRGDEDASVFRAILKPVKVTAGKTRKLATIKLPAVGTATIKGKVTGAKSPGGKTHAVTVQSKNHIAFGTVNKKGNVKVRNLPAGTYKVSLEGANLSKKVKVAKGKTKSFGTLKRAKGKTISGVVKTSNNKLAKGVRVWIHDSAGTTLGSVLTNSKGKYSIKGAAKGKYTATTDSLSLTQGEAKAKTVTVKKGKKAKINLKLIRSGTITGRIVNSKNLPIAGVEVRTEPGRGTLRSYANATTDANGVYKIEGLPPGKYTITTTDPFEGGYYNGSSTKAVKVKSAKNTRGATLKLRS